MPPPSITEPCSRRSVGTSRPSSTSSAPGGDNLTYDSNFADSSQVTAERGEVEALAGQLRETLSGVELALGKLSGDNYGVCEDCGEPINPLRLEAKPAARYCINCAAKH